MDNAVPRARGVLRCRLDVLGWLRFCFLALLFTVYASRLHSQTATDEPIQPKPLHFDLTPLVGYLTSMAIPTGTDFQERGPRLIFDAKPSYGMAVGVRLDEENLIEIRWARQDTYVHLEGGPPSPKTKVDLDQFHGDFTHEYILENWKPWARPFVLGSIGATRLAGGANNSITRFSFGLGGGIKLYFTRHVGLRMQAEWLPILLNPGVGSFVCGGGCVVQLSGTLVSQGEIVVGPIFRF